MRCNYFVYITRGFLSRMICLSLGFVKVLLLGHAWSSGGRWLHVTLSLPGPCRVMGTALWLSCASAGPSLAQTEPLSLSFVPAISGWQSQGRAGQAWVFVPRVGSIHGCAHCQPCPWSTPPEPGQARGLCYPDQCLQPPSSSPAHPSLSPTPQSARAKHQLPLQHSWALKAWTRLQRKE